MRVSITIPTLRTREEMEPMIQKIKNTLDKTYEYEVYASCIQQSAALNRNWCIEHALGDIIVQLDDDIDGFYPNWVNDLITPLIQNPEQYSIVASRLLTREGNIAPQLGDCGCQSVLGTMQVAVHTKETNLNIVGSACISFYKSDGILFDTNYKGACYEDTDFCMQYGKKFPNKQIMINNKCKLIHYGESKGYEVPHNKNYFHKKWGICL